ncbi:hypothetical protein [Pelagibacterium halotolerans]|uniref:hypothetical protein n=1 Tax=Pelagibacterium halotolerans TaxID=531813 RepID=UPI00384B326C
MSIRQQGTGYVADYPDAQGNRRQKLFSDRDSAILHHDLNTHGGIFRPAMSTRAFVTLYRDAVRVDATRSETSRRNCAYWLSRCIPDAPVAPLDRLAPHEVLAWRRAVAPDPSTHLAHACLAVLRAAFDFALASGLCRRNPIRASDHGYVKRPKPGPLFSPTRGERGALAEYFTGGVSLAFDLMNTCALRLSEVVALTAHCYDPITQRLELFATYDSHSNQIVHMRNAARARPVGVEDEGLAARLAAAVPAADPYLVRIRGRAGTILKSTMARREIARQLRDAQKHIGIECPETSGPYQPDAFRRAAVIDRIEAGGADVNILKVMAFSGYAAPTDFMNRFGTFIREPDERDEMERVAALMRVI